MLKIEEHKFPQHNIPSSHSSVPKNLYLPLSQHIGKPSQATVGKAENVLCGQKIAESSGKISSSLHSPVTGSVVDIKYFSHPVLRRYKAVVVRRQDKDFSIDFPEDSSRLKGLSREEILDKIADKGIVGMGGAGFPAHVKLSPPKKVDILVVNGCECEPYLSCDYRLMKENMEGILKGIEAVSHILDVEKVLFCVEKNKKDIGIVLSKAFENTRPVFRQDMPFIVFKLLPARYPQGAEKQLINNVLRRVVPSGGLPFDVGVVVHNVSTLYAIYECLWKDKPLIERMVTFAGDCLKEPKNLWVKIGTSVRDLVENEDLVLVKEPCKIIFGGPMMGYAQEDLEVPITKTTGGVLFLSKEELVFKKEYPCISCANCVKSCPMGLLPSRIYLSVKNRDLESLKKLRPKDCIECGNCSYSCPSGIRLVEYIKWAKTLL